MMIKRGDAKTGTVVEAATAKEVSICPNCGRLRQATERAECPCRQVRDAAAEPAESKEEAPA